MFLETVSKVLNFMSVEHFTCKVFNHLISVSLMITSSDRVERVHHVVSFILLLNGKIVHCNEQFSKINLNF